MNYARKLKIHTTIKEKCDKIVVNGGYILNASLKIRKKLLK